METLTKINNKGNEKQKVFSYDTNNLNQYLDRSIYIDIVEDEEETSTGSIIDTTATGSIEITSTEIITEEEFVAEDTEEEEVIEEEIEIELEGKLIYDNNGNLIGNLLNNKRQYIYSYDYKNRLIKIEKNLFKTLPNPLFTSEGTESEFITKQKIVQITYDVLGRRIQKEFNNGAYRNYIYSN